MARQERSDHPFGPVPRRALAISLFALAVPVAGALLFPASLGEYGAILWLLALVPAFLLAYYRGWRGVTVAFGAGMVLLALTQVVGFLTGHRAQDPPLMLMVVAAYVGAALGIGWLTDVLGDVTERRHREEALRQLEKALETMQVGVTITDATGKITYANPAEARQHGYTVEELVGRDAGVYAPAGRRRSLTPAELKTLSSWKRESINVRKDGTLFPVHLTSDVVFGVTGEPIGLVTTCEDIAERKLAERRLRKAYGDIRESHTALQAAQMQLIEVEKMESVGRLAAGVAHEVKNPLMTLLTGVKYLARHVPMTDENVQILLGDMLEAVSRADSVIMGLLDFSAPRELELKAADLNAIVERALRLVKHEVSKAQVMVVDELDGDLPSLTLDGFKIQQVLVNTLTNAAHATPPGGQITVRTSVRPLLLVDSAAGDADTDAMQAGRHAVFLEVEDTGKGIPEDQLTKVCDPFFTTKPTGSGTGLGLSVTRQIVEMHGATIDIRNREEGGVRVTMVFKLDEERPHDGEEAHPGG